MKIASSFILEDVMDMRSGSRHPIPWIFMSFVDASQVNSQDDPQGRVAEVQAVQTVKLALKILFPSNKSSEGTLDLHWSVDANATLNIQANLKWISIKLCLIWNEDDWLHLHLMEFYTLQWLGKEKS